MDCVSHVLQLPNMIYYCRHEDYNKLPLHNGITLKPVIAGSLCSKAEKNSKVAEAVKLVLFYLLISHSLNNLFSEPGKLWGFSIILCKKVIFESFNAFQEVPCQQLFRFPMNLLPANSGIRTFFWSQNCGHLQKQLRTILTALKFRGWKLSSLLKWLKRNCTQLLHQSIFQDSKVQFLQ